MLAPFKGVIMPVQSQDTTTATIARNVIAFPVRARKPSVKIVCIDNDGMRTCAHCGGWMAEDESDEDCSSLRVSKAR
jgi:hypothetical protein